MDDSAGAAHARTPPRAGEARGASHLELPAPGRRPHGTDRGTAGLLAVAVIAMGMLAGLFYAFDVAVMPGLVAAEDRTFVDGMHQMIELPAFPLTLFAALALTVVALLRARRSGSAEAATWIAVALALYVVMVVVSVAVHFPLNDQLMRAGEPARIEDPAAVRDAFVGPWVAWNVVRTLALTGAFGCLVRALVVHGRTGRTPHGARPRS